MQVRAFERYIPLNACEKLHMFHILYILRDYTPLKGVFLLINVIKSPLISTLRYLIGSV